MSSNRKSPFIRYRYDALDRMIGYNKQSDLSHQHFYCDSHLATELEGGKYLSIFRYGEQLLGQLLRQNDENTSTLLSTDLPGTVFTAIKTDLKHFMAYSPYGNRPFGSGLISLLGFTGQRPDAVTGHYLLGNGYRAFNPTLMRFNSPDSSSPFDKGGLNAYAYCAGDPVNRKDLAGDAFAGIIKPLKKYTSMRLSRELGYNVKPVDKILFNTGDMFAFEDLNGQRLTVVGHGDTSGGKVILNGKSTDAFGLNDFASANGINMDQYKGIRTVICYSGNKMRDTAGKTIDAFGDDLSFITGRPVKSYLGNVHSSFVNEALKELPADQIYNGRYYFGVLKNKSIRGYSGTPLEVNYQPVYFDNKIGRKHT